MKVLLKYIRKDLLMTEEQLLKEEEGKANEPKPQVLVVSDSAEKLKEVREALGERFKGVFVRDEASAEKYLSKHQVEFIIRDGNSEK
ncbi:MAG: hypothetical protein IJU50_06450 [Lachnospiraceae bacterium]|nr:hypothetical protein [Lachnospiraceae bacterium]